MAGIWIAAFFSQSGVPKTGLSTTIDIWEIATATQSVNGGAMTERGDGWYVYNFTTYDQTKQYGITIDGSSTLAGAERYKFQILSYHSAV